MTYFLLTATAFLWGGTFIAGRIVAAEIPPLTASFLRFVIAAATMVPILIGAGGLPPLPNRRQGLVILVLGLTGIFFYNVCFFTGLAHISASRAALIIASTPLAITITATLVYREPLSRSRGLGIGLSLIGALFVISDGHPTTLLSGGFGIGELSLLGCVLSWTTYTIVGRKALQTMQPLPCVFYAILAGTALLAIPAFLEGLPSLLPTIDFAGWSGLAYLGICGTALGFCWYYQGVQRIGPSRAGIFINLVPVFAVLQSWVILSESLKPMVLLGGSLVCVGVFLTSRPLKAQ